MPLSDFYPEMKDWVSAENPPPAQKPQIPDPETRSTPYLRAPLPLPAQYSGDTIKQYVRPELSSFRIAPLGPSGIAAFNAAAVSAQPPQKGAVSDIGDLIWRGQWLNFITYQINDVVLDNISAYVAVQSNVNSEPDSGSTSWALLSKNLNFRGQWI